MQANTTFWDKRAQSYDADIKKHDSLYTRTIEGMKPLLGGSDTVLDLGCGSGEMSIDIASGVQRMTGIDTSREMIDIANRKVLDRGVENVDFRQADVFDRELTEASFSVVTAFSVLHLVNDIPRVLVRLRELLQSGGLLVVQTPCLGERKRLVRSLIGLAQRLRIAPPINDLTFAESKSLVTTHGFQIIEHEIWDEKWAIQRILARKATP